MHVKSNYVFSALDLMKGYHQVKVRDEGEVKVRVRKQVKVKISSGEGEKTAFACHQGLHQYRRMPFGMTNAWPCFNS